MGQQTYTPIRQRGDLFPVTADPDIRYGKLPSQLWRKVYRNPITHGDWDLTSTERARLQRMVEVLKKNTGAKITEIGPALSKMLRSGGGQALRGHSGSAEIYYTPTSKMPAGMPKFDPRLVQIHELVHAKQYATQPVTPTRWQELKFILRGGPLFTEGEARLRETEALTRVVGKERALSLIPEKARSHRALIEAITKPNYRPRPLAEASPELQQWLRDIRNPWSRAMSGLWSRLRAVIRK